MKPLPKHPKQQRMEDMTFPLVKGDYTGGVNKNRHGNVLKPGDFSSDKHEDVPVFNDLPQKEQIKIIEGAMTRQGSFKIRKNGRAIIVIDPGQPNEETLRVTPAQAIK